MTRYHTALPYCRIQLRYERAARGTVYKGRHRAPSVRRHRGRILVPWHNDMVSSARKWHRRDPDRASLTKKKNEREDTCASQLCPIVYNAYLHTVPRNYITVRAS